MSNVVGLNVIHGNMEGWDLLTVSRGSINIHIAMFANYALTLTLACVIFKHGKESYIYLIFKCMFDEISFLCSEQVCHMWNIFLHAAKTIKKILWTQVCKAGVYCFLFNRAEPKF